MATLDELSNRLMKPAKDLADWNFPLTKILEEYCTLVNEQDDVNFSSAALVVQNSTNVYVRRTEYLFHDIAAFKQSFAEDEAENATKEAKKGAKKKNALIDFADFETNDFTTSVGKNINIKTRTGTNNFVKLLGQRFPQLENSRFSLPIDVRDIHGENVGKKYDFRCNEHLTASGMLVEHLTPEVFSHDSPDRNTNTPTASPENGINLIASLEPTQLSSERNTDLMSSLVSTRTVAESEMDLSSGFEATRTVAESGTHENSGFEATRTVAESGTRANSGFEATQSIAESGTQVNSEFEATQSIAESGTQVNSGFEATQSTAESGMNSIANEEQAQLVPETDCAIDGDSSCQKECEDPCAVHEKDSGLLDTSFASSFDSGLGSSIQNSNARPDSSISNFADCHWEEPLQPRPDSCFSIADDGSLAGRDPLPLDGSSDNAASVEEKAQNAEEQSGEALQANDSPIDNHNAESRENTVGDRTADANVDGTLESISQIANARTRSSKRLKNVIDAVNNLNPKEWEPIPFVGVPDELPKSRAEFKLPCPISLLKSKDRPRKQRITPKMQKKRRLETSMTECRTSGEKMTLYSPTRQLYYPFKKDFSEEFGDFQTCIEERYKNRDLIDYEAVEDASLSLLGFRTKVQKRKRETRGESDIDTFSMTDSYFEKQLGKRPKIDAAYYEAVTNISMDLLGFTTSVPKSDPVINGIVSSIGEPTENIESTETAVEDFPMPVTPESSDSSEEMPPSTPPPTYHSRIEQSVRDIYDSADARTAQEEAVAKWHEYMKPKLREAERRPPFDVKQYSARVIEKIKAKDDGKIDFREMVHQHEPTEVARYFLASLQLANKYSLHIDTSHNVEGNITLVLFNKDR